MDGYQSKDNIIQNLKDAGCDNETITSFLNYKNKGMVKESLKLLATYRKSILVNLHINQKQIDCLDYLSYQMKKANTNLK